MNKFAHEVLKSAHNCNFEIQGYTDNTGAKLYNLKLSKERAEATANYLKSQGLNCTFSSIGFGDERPIVKNDTEENRSKNRRVEIYRRN